MKIVFMGTPDFAAVSLKKLLSSGHEVMGVVTIPDKARGRGQKLAPSAVKRLALEQGLEILQPLRLKDPGFLQQLQNYRADVFVVVAFRILPREVFSIPPQGTLNLHASLLPKYRGAAPINWALINGDSVTGVTTMRIDAKVDTGNILLQEKQQITPEMDAGTLHDLLAEKGAALMLKTLDLLESGEIAARVQDESQVTKAPKISKETARLNFDRPAAEVHNLIRGLSPYPAAFCYHQNKQLKVFRSMVSPAKQTRFEPGTVCDIAADYFEVACATDNIRIFELQIAGKKRMAVRDFLNGYSLKKGDVLL